MPRTREQREWDPDRSQIASRLSTSLYRLDSRGARLSTTKYSSVGERPLSQKESQPLPPPLLLEDDIDEKYIRLLRQVRAQQKQKKIKTLKFKLVDEDSTIDIEITSVSLSMRKRKYNLSDIYKSSERAFLRSLKMSDYLSFYRKL